MAGPFARGTFGVACSPGYRGWVIVHACSHHTSQKPHARREDASGTSAQHRGPALPDTTTPLLAVAVVCGLAARAPRRSAGALRSNARTPARARGRGANRRPASGSMEPSPYAAAGQAVDVLADDDNGVLAVSGVPTWMASIRKSLNHGGTQRPKRDRREANRKNLQLATVDGATGRPAVRTVVFRGFLNGSSPVLTFITDTRAQKVRHIADANAAGKSAWCEACWWFEEASVQYRISGQLIMATATSEPELSAIASTVWERLGDSSRGTFSWPDPGCPKSKETVTTSTTAPEAPPPSKARAPLPFSEANFAVVLLLPDRIDELRLGGRQKRFIHTLAGASPGDGDGGGAPPLLASETAAEPLVLLKHAQGLTAEDWVTAEVNP